MQIRTKFIIPVAISLTFLTGIVTFNFYPIPCQASVKGSKLSVFSLEVKDQPLEKVLEKVSKLTGYEITVNKEALDFPVTASFKNINVYEGLRRIFGSLNHSIISNDKEKRISVYVINGIQKKSKDLVYNQSNQKYNQKEIDTPDEVLKSRCKYGKEITPDELKAMEHGKEITPDELKAMEHGKEITPDELKATEYGKGITPDELKAMEREVNLLQETAERPTC